MMVTLVIAVPDDSSAEKEELVQTQSPNPKINNDLW